MKTKFSLVFGICALMANAVIVSCGSTEKVATNPVVVLDTTPKPVQKSEYYDTGELPLNSCERLAEEAPAIRSVGKGTHFNEMTARDIAEMRARARFASSLATKIKATATEFALGYNQYSGNFAIATNLRDDQGSKISNLSQSVAENIVKNTTAIKTIKYLLPDKQYEYWVCLEYRGTASMMAEDIAKQVLMQPTGGDQTPNVEEYSKKIGAELEQVR